MVSYLKDFTMTQLLKNISTMKDDEELYTKEEQHFGGYWKLRIKRSGDHLQLHMFCSKPLLPEEWRIETCYELKVMSTSGHCFSKGDRASIGTLGSFVGFGFQYFMKWKTMEEEFLINDSFIVEAHLKILEIGGFEKKVQLRNFDESMKDFSDVVLVVKDVKFYVIKKFLAAQSAYFKAMFLGDFDESQSSEVTLADIDPSDFQNFLEVLYGHPQAVTDNTVQGILVLVDMYDVPTVGWICEQFLVKESRMSLKRKLEISLRFKLETLKRKCLTEIEGSTA